jgi:hypothetical protein
MQSCSEAELRTGKLVQRGKANRQSTNYDVILFSSSNDAPYHRGRNKDIVLIPGDP